jgi:hypothetical protein
MKTGIDIFSLPFWLGEWENPEKTIPIRLCCTASLLRAFVLNQQ